MNPQFDAVFYYVSDLGRGIAFYSEVLGLKLKSRDVVARFDLGGILVELVPAGREARILGQGNARLCLRVDDISAAVAELRMKGVSVRGPERKENGILAALQDPDGNEVCLWQYTAVIPSGEPS